MMTLGKSGTATSELTNLSYCLLAQDLRTCQSVFICCYAVCCDICRFSVNYTIIVKAKAMVTEFDVKNLNGVCANINQYTYIATLCSNT